MGKAKSDNLNVFGVDNSYFRQDNSIGPGRPRKGIKRDSITLEEKKFLNSLSLRTILDSDRRVQDLAEKWAQKRLKSKISTIQGQQSMAFGLLVGIVYPIVLKSLSKKIGSPFRYLSDLQVHILISAWVVTQLTGPVFHAKQLLPYKVVPKGKKDCERIQNELSQLIYYDIVFQPDDEMVYSLSKKIPAKTGKRGRPRKYYIISNSGKTCLKEYFEKYNNIHSRITGNFWLNDLKKLQF